MHTKRKKRLKNNKCILYSFKNHTKALVLFAYNPLENVLSVWYNKSRKNKYFFKPVKKTEKGTVN